MGPSRLHGDSTPVAVLAVDDEDATEFRLVDELHPVRDGKEPHASSRLTASMWVVQPAALLSIVVQSSCPLLERHLIQRQIARQAAGTDWTATGHVPESLDPGCLAQIDVTIRPPGR